MRRGLPQEASVDTAFGVGASLARRRLLWVLGARHPLEQTAHQHAEDKAHERADILPSTAPSVALVRACSAALAAAVGVRDEAQAGQHTHEGRREDDCQEAMQHLGAVDTAARGKAAPSVAMPRSIAGMARANEEYRERDRALSAQTRARCCFQTGWL
eukprot:CAMPEP_0183511284 /NCGR_PEP_ID=MMETSP0371-20130417/10801_1 /TAXON_ID=268820 /ORGANISM="Peridinium aciculiferum, Strain PAER-2" /LENGTH=157 /DNA_ID=CAMNT_0025708189 /DNA_START=168 /DNA_END=639 /DNA_ORIENTATION=-